MSNTGKFKDRNADIRGAGKVVTNNEECASKCLFFEKPPDTPPHIKKWRNLGKHEPGKKVIHPGVSDDKIDQLGLMGKKTMGSEHTDTVLKPNNLDGLAE